MDLNTSLRILDLDAAADAATIKRAYKAKVRRWHPDQFPEGSSKKAEAEERLKQINIAYARLREHPAFQPPAPDVAAGSSPSPRPDATDAAGGNTAPRRSWFDHLFDTLNAFTSGDDPQRRDASLHEPPAGPQRRSFSQVLDEIAGSRCTAAQKPRPAVPTAGRYGNPAVGPRRTRRHGGRGDAAEGVAPVEPVKPVGRVRGIGRRR